MGKDKKCLVFCYKSVMKEVFEWLREIVRDGYVVEWIVDNFFGVMMWVQDSEEWKFYFFGFLLGYIYENGGGLDFQFYFNNYFIIVICYWKVFG